MRTLPNPDALGRRPFRSSGSLAKAAARWGASMLAVIAASACAGDPAVVSGTIEQHTTIVSAELPSTVASLHVEEGDTVEVGELLVTLDCVDAEAQVERAAASLAGASATSRSVEDGARAEELASARAQVEIADERLQSARRGATAEERTQREAAVQSAQARLALAELTLSRMQTLVGSGASTVAARDIAAAELASAQAALQAADAQALAARRGPRREERNVLEQQREQAQQALALLEAGATTPARDAARAVVAERTVALHIAQTAAGRCSVRSPVAGNVTVVARRVGEVVGAGSPLVAVAEHGSTYVRTYAPQVWLADLRLGARLVVDLDIDPTQSFEAHVRHIYETPEFTGTNIQTPDDRAHLVYRMDLSLTDDTLSVRAGQTVTVRAPSAAARGDQSAERP